jgi:hypothetical protein
MLNKKECLHHAYLLRCWQERKASASEKPRWRFCIEEVLQERPRQGFDDLDALVTFLRAELDDQDAGQIRPGGSSEGRTNERIGRE